MANDEVVHKVIPAGRLEHRQVAKVVLQPTGLRLKINKQFDICLLEHLTHTSTLNDNNAQVT